MYGRTIRKLRVWEQDMAMLDDELLQQLQTEFLDATDDALDQLEAAVDGAVRGGGDPKAALHVVRRQVHSIKGLSASFGFKLSSAIAHRLEDYLDEETELTADIARSVGKFTDRIREIARAGSEPTEDAAAELLRSLPARRPPPDIIVTAVDVEVLIGVPSKLTAKIVRDVLQNCGFRVVRASTMIDCFTMTVRARPDAMLFAMTLDELSGADLARAFRAMSATADVPVGVLTSFSLDHAALRDLPEGISIVRLGKQHFDGDMAEFLARIEVG